MTTVIPISEDEFVETFRPIKNPLDPQAPFDLLGDDSGHGCMFETHGTQLAFVVRMRDTEPGRVWTLLEVSDSPGSLARHHIVPGMHLVNRTGYIVTEIPWSTADIEVRLDPIPEVDHRATEPTPASDAERIRSCLIAAMDYPDNDDKALLRDALTDLRHLAAARNIDWRHCLETSAEMARYEQAAASNTRPKT